MSSQYNLRRTTNIATRCHIVRVPLGIIAGIIVIIGRWWRRNGRLRSRRGWSRTKQHRNRVEIDTVIVVIVTIIIAERLTLLNRLIKHIDSRNKHWRLSLIIGTSQNIHSRLKTRIIRWWQWWTVIVIVVVVVDLHNLLLIMHINMIIMIINLIINMINMLNSNMFVALYTLLFILHMWWWQWHTIRLGVTMLMTWHLQVSV